MKWRSIFPCCTEHDWWCFRAQWGHTTADQRCSSTVFYFAHGKDQRYSLPPSDPEMTKSPSIPVKQQASDPTSSLLKSGAFLQCHHWLVGAGESEDRRPPVLGLSRNKANECLSCWIGQSNFQFRSETNRGDYKRWEKTNILYHS